MVCLRRPVALIPTPGREASEYGTLGNEKWRWKTEILSITFYQQQITHGLAQDWTRQRTPQEWQPRQYSHRFPYIYLSLFRLLSYRPCRYSGSFYTVPHTHTHTHFSNGCVITQMMTTHISFTGPNSEEPQVWCQDHQQIMMNFALYFAVHIGLHNVDYKRRFLNPGVLSGRWNRVRLPLLRT